MRYCSPDICSGFESWLQLAAAQVVDLATACLAAIHSRAKVPVLEMLSRQLEIEVDLRKQLFWQQVAARLSQVSR